ncbi:diacylglycerol/lipid kinase family protein [Microbacterium indicum]|uniref:diacylglycerol/lipid kinase family protein n=1 Tax=Microbacterium indicum TaxID=358100 RepID=UPI0003F7F0B2|nr:diacylglycerol kinase family protein [Microbacterium indicum]
MADEQAEAGRAALVFNPVKVADIVGLRRAIAARSRDAGWPDPLFLPTSVEDPGQGATREALVQGASVVLVAGGDGTVRAVAEAMRGSGVPLAIVPSGTGNLLARNLRLPLASVEPMVDAAFSGDAAAVDIGVATLTREDGTKDEHAFVVMAGMGLDAAMIANTSARLKKQVGWVAYVDGAARSLPRAKPFRIAYQFRGEHVHTAKVQSILFANCGHLPAGIELMPDARVDDGRLDVAVIQPSGAFGWLGVARTITWNAPFLRRSAIGRRVERTRGQSIRYLTGDAIEAKPDEARPVELDGDEFGDAVLIRCVIDEGGLLLSMPAGHTF